MSRGTTQPMKVVIINTQYIETDAVNFKSVVQRLTGKEARDAAHPTTSAGTGEGLFSKKKRRHDQHNRSGSAAEFSRANSFLSGGVPFKELDRLLMDMPSALDDLIRTFDHPIA